MSTLFLFILSAAVISFVLGQWALSLILWVVFWIVWAVAWYKA